MCAFFMTIHYNQFCNGDWFIDDKLHIWSFLSYLFFLHISNFLVELGSEKLGSKVTICFLKLLTKFNTLSLLCVFLLLSHFSQFDFNFKIMQNVWSFCLNLNNTPCKIKIYSYLISSRYYRSDLLLLLF